jgi:CheY-like chemotaxis protein/HPt (histidine-containing phosphotransfer) domain-containing protein
VDEEHTQNSTRQAEESADAANLARTQFLAMIIHELRTPLSGMLGMLESLLADELSSEQRRRASMASLSGRMMLRLINDILDLARMEAGHFELRMQPCDLVRAIEAATLGLLDRARAKGLDMRVLYGPLLPRRVHCDELRFQQIMTNLLANAVKFTDQGTVTLESRLEWIAEGRCGLYVSVTDTGVGIPIEDQSCIFDAFTQVDSSPTRKFLGTGLGLSICKRLVESMGGTIGVASEAGVGSTFWFRIPVTLSVTDALPAGQVDRPALVIVSPANECQVRLIGLARDSGMEWAIAESIAHARSIIGDWQCRGRRAIIVLSDEESLAPGDCPTSWPSTEEPPIEIVSILLTGKPDGELYVGDHSDPRPIVIAKPLTAGVLRTVVALSETYVSRDDGTSVIPEMAASSAMLLDPAVAECRSAVRILLADDNELSRKAIESMLTVAGYRCHAVSNGQEAIEAIADGEFDLVLMDYHMPITDGLEATRYIRKREREVAAAGAGPVGRLPIVALTASALTADAELGMEAGMDNFLTKPVRIQDLVATVERHLRSGNAVPDQAQRATTRMAGATDRGGPDRPPIDLDALERSWAGDREQVAGLCRLFYAQVKASRAEIGVQVAQSNRAALLQTVHNLKGAAGFVQAMHVRDRAEALERALRLSESADAAPAVTALQASIDECMTFMTCHLAAKYGPLDRTV